MKKLIRVVISCVLILSCFAGCGKEQSTTPTGFEKNFKVAVVQQVEHASLDEISAAVMAELKAQAEAKGVGMVVEKFNGQGDQTALNQIGAQAVSDGYDAIVPVATRAAQCMVTAAEGTEIPIIYAAVSDPEAAGLTGIPTVSGVSDALNTPFILDMMLAVQPEVKTVGLLYSSSEPNSAAPIAEAKAYLDGKGIAYLEKTGNTADEIIAANEKEYVDYLADFSARFETEMPKEKVARSAALTLAAERLMEKNNCTVGAMECWPATAIYGAPVCPTLGEMADRGYPISCETDVNGAITMAILRAVVLNRQAEFLADLTIRHPENENAELLWHCGPFAYSLKKESSAARLVDGQESFILRDGELTLCRFDEVDGKHYLFCGEGHTTDGPETTGTYLWLEVDNWKRWEEKLIFGPYIHHVGGTYGSYKKELREAARYLGMIFDDADEQGIASL